MPAVARKKSQAASGCPEAEDFPTPVRIALEKALAALEAVQLATPGRRPMPRVEVRGIALEQDSELPSWQYALVSICLVGAEQGRRDELEGRLIEAVYSKLNHRDATRVLVEFCEDV